MYDSFTESASSTTAIAPTDGERLMRFVRRRDEDAFGEVVDAHASMVWGVCWQVLRQREDVEDAFQATFFILARKAHTIHANDSAAAWLYRVAFRTALRLKEQRGRRATETLVEQPLTDDDPFAQLAAREQTSALLEELQTLPDRYQRPLVLHYLEAKSRSAVAEELGTTTATVKGRLARGRSMLRSRLARRGVALSAAMGAAVAALETSAAVLPAALPAKMAGLSTAFRLQKPLPNGGAAAANLATKGLTAMTLATTMKPAAGLLAVALAAALLTSVQADEDAGAAGVGQSRQEPAAALDLQAATVDLLAAADDEVAAESNIAVAPSPDAVERPVPMPTLRTERGAEDSPTFRVVPSRDAGERAQVVPQDGPGGQQNEGGNSGLDLRGSDIQALAPKPGLTYADATPQPQTIRNDRQQPILPSPLYRDPQVVTLTSEQSIPAGGKKQLELERDYWKLKAEALEAKAEVTALKSQALADGGETPPMEVQELKVEALLLRAEVKLCQSKSVELEGKIKLAERLEKANQQTYQPYPTPNLFTDPSPQPTPSPTLTPQPSLRRSNPLQAPTLPPQPYGRETPNESGSRGGGGYGRGGGEYGSRGGGRGGYEGTSRNRETPPVGQPAKLAPGNVIHIEVIGALPDKPIDGEYTIEPSGTVALGAAYGRVNVAGKNLLQAEEEIKLFLSSILKETQVQVTRLDASPSPFGP